MPDTFVILSYPSGQCSKSAECVLSIKIGTFIKVLFIKVLFVILLFGKLVYNSIIFNNIVYNGIVC